MPQTTRSDSVTLVWMGILAIASMLSSSAAVNADDTAQIKTRTGRRTIKLWPRPEDRQSQQPGVSITLGDWVYRATKAPSAKDGVPWQLIVTPANEASGEWRKGSFKTRIPHPVPMAVRSIADEKQKPDTIPVIKMPQVLWKQRMESALQDVVGIHFHEYVSDDLARILYTLHKVPPDNPDGSQPANHRGVAGTRVEATLMAPILWSLDQSIVVRVDKLEEHLVEPRIKHESGHADISQDVLLAVLRGKQSWNPVYCTGRRSQVEYYWKRELIGRSWKGYQKNVGKLLTLRTSVVLVPPTRWSLLLPIPPERVTQKHIQQLNDSIVQLDSQFQAVDKAAQDRFHSHHGEYENTRP